MKIFCPRCQTENETDAAQAGQIECAGCGKYFSANPASGSVNRSPSRTRPCPSCSHGVSLAANSCPSCGHTFHQPGGINAKDPVHVLGLFTCLIIVVLVVYFIFTHI